MGHSCEKRERRRNENGHVPQWTVPAFRIFRRAHCFPRASSVDNGHVCEQFSTQPTHTHTHTHKVHIRSHGGTRVGVTTPLLGRMYNCDWFQEPRSKTISCRKSLMQSAACQHPRFQAIYAPHQGQRSSGAVFTNARLVTSHPSTYCQDVLLCASFMKKDFKSVEVNRIQDCGQILNLCSPGAAYAASPQ